MADTPEETEETPPKASKLPLILGLALAVLGGGAGYFAVSSGLILGAETASKESATDKKDSLSANMTKVAYIDVDPLTVSLRPPSDSKHLRFRASLEVMPEAVEAVKQVLPRVTDVLNSYLRALEPADLEDPAALARLRAQMLRRVQVVAGLGQVNDLLIMEFVLN